MKITRRPAEASDRELVRRMHHQGMRESVERQFGPWDDEQQDRFFERSWHDATFEIVECDGTPCGYIGIEDRADDVYVRMIVVSLDYQGRGIGTALLQAAMQEAERRGVPVRLGTFHHNRAQALYRRLGFRETGRTATHIPFEWRGSGDQGAEPMVAR
jgi:ribosomal protein S18 acetylase RimI-like enzyme